MVIICVSTPGAEVFKTLAARPQSLDIRVTETIEPVGDHDYSRVRIDSIDVRKVLNSHAEWSNEFIVVLDNGATGYGSSPRGETLSIHEKSGVNVSAPEGAASTIQADASLYGELDQHQFDHILETHRDSLGPGAMYALSQAFLNATAASLGLSRRSLLGQFRDKRLSAPTRFPYLLFNLLNGGPHAYTNPVLCDFSEFLLVPRSGSLEQHIAGFRVLKRRVAEELSVLPTCRVGGNLVHQRSANSNRGWIDFLLEILEKEGLSSQFGLMIDAAAGRLLVDGRYQFSITGEGSLTPDEYLGFWTNLLSSYPIDIVEDPFAEIDTEAWKALTAEFPDRLVAGDDLCATNARRIEDGISNGWMSAVLIKPNQAGTISATTEALNTAGSHGVSMIPSHRSIETDSTLLSDICSVFDLKYTKLGLLSDFETILKLNQLIRNFDDADDQGHNNPARRNTI